MSKHSSSFSIAFAVKSSEKKKGAKEAKKTRILKYLL